MMRHTMPSSLLKVIEWVVASLEMILSLFLIVGVVAAGFMMATSLHGIFAAGTASEFQKFLDDSLLYIIGLEVAYMLIKRDPHLVIDILIFAISRKMIMTMDTGWDFFLGAMAIFLLYMVKCYGISCILLPRNLWKRFGTEAHESEVSTE